MQSIKKTAVGLLAAGSLLITAPLASAADTKIGVVDIQQIFQKTDLGKSIQAHLKRFADRRVSKLKETEKKLQDEQGQIRQEVGVISKEALKSKEEAFQKEVQDFRKRQQKVQTEVASESFVGFRKFLNAVNAATASLGKKYHFAMILSQHPLRVPLGPYPPPFQSPRFLYMNPDADITQSVINYVNAHSGQ